MLKITIMKGDLKLYLTKIYGHLSSKLTPHQKKKAAHRIFRAVKILLYDTIIMKTCHTFVQTHRMYNIKSEA